MIGWFYKIKYGISNLIRWLPIVWKDRNYDHHFIDVVLHFKLQNTYKTLVGSNVNWHTHKKELQALRICILILERRLNDWHFSLATPNQPMEKVHTLEAKKQTEFNLFTKLYAKYQESWWC